MELIAYIQLVRKWFWLLLLGAFLAGGAAFLFRSQQAKQYQSHVTISVGNFIEAPNPDSSEIRTGVELAQTYAVLATTYDVLEATVEAGDFPVTAAELRSVLSTRVIPDTSLLELTITYTDPVLAADMANELAQQLILNSPSNLTPDQQQQLDLATTEIERLNQELQQARLQLTDIDAQLASETDPTEIDRLTEQRNTLTSQINEKSATIANFSSTITTLQRRTNSLDIVERARIPTSPTGASVISTTLLGAMVGIALAGGIALLIEYLDDTIKTTEEAVQMLELPVLAAITRFGKQRDTYQQRLITFNEPGSHVSEEYRTLRTNLMFASNGHATKAKDVLVVTSPGPSEGKSVTASNLAVTMAMAGWRVLLVDADLRRPRVHELFGLDNSCGLSTLLSAEPSGAHMNGGRGLDPDLKSCLQNTEIPGLRVITSGYIPLNPTEVLGSAVMKRWVQEFRSSANVDVILFDTPPALVVADSSVLCSAVDASVVLVIEAGQSRRAAVLRAKDQFVQLGINIKGVVLNAISPKNHGGYGYGYGYYYYEDPKLTPKERQKQSK
ncbi:MAG TPA: polysaccharide biosynthesis tyrosine autokinase [Aggregatilinea sp.]|jgi:non-specific protein-tyrosine kinase|uniref:polysaccharide biosynthesis tyrosine autokinase n=1 Tax=Aggregatilinea sp. TaxID=2806333 RepID=UPI002BAAA90B|nr:polysaccharide biosynthesis tyrosine autokinase [Aggregatilinea sp.]HML21593.1 polysaccharide biosynthesis tyrosine autokinase [Aggregatilinea sp.]